jgi:hypothetical protein
VKKIVASARIIGKEISEEHPTVSLFEPDPFANIFDALSWVKRG